MKTKLEETLGQITWGNVLELGMDGPCEEAVKYVENKFNLEKETRLCSKYLNDVRKHNSEWAEWFLYVAVEEMSDLTGEQKIILAKKLESEEEKFNIATDVSIPNLTRKQRFELVKDLKNRVLRHEAADYVPNLTIKQRKELDQLYNK